MARKNQTTSAGNPTTHSGCGNAFVLTAGCFGNLAGTDCSGRGRHAGAIYWHSKTSPICLVKSGAFRESSISDLESEYRAKFPHDPLSVLREILVYILKRRLLKSVVV